MWFQLIYIVRIWGSWGPIRTFLSTHFSRLNNPDSQPAITCLVLQHSNHVLGPPPDLLRYTNIFLLLLYNYMYIFICMCVFVYVCIWKQVEWVWPSFFRWLFYFYFLIHIKFCWWTTAYYSNASRWLDAINLTWFNELLCINRAAKLPPLSTENAKQVIMRIWLPTSVKKLRYYWTEEIISCSEGSNLYEIDFIFYFMK